MYTWYGAESDTIYKKCLGTRKNTILANIIDVNQKCKLLY